VSRRGGPEVLELVNVDLPPPPPGYVVVRTAAAGVSFGDVLLRVGVIPGGPKLPFVPGYDVTGEVEAVGEGVVAPRPGQLVTALIRSGGYAERVVVPAVRLVPVPAGLDLRLVAATSLNYFVARQMLRRVAAVRAGDEVLVHGAAGGVGSALLQLAALDGVRCHGTSSAAKRDAVTRLGARHIDYRRDDFVALMRERPGGGVAAVFDPVGGGTFGRSYRALRRGGVLVCYGQSAALRNGSAHRLTGARGVLVGILVPKLLPDGRRSVFYNAWCLERTQPQAYRDDLTELLAMLAEGKIAPTVARTMPLPEVAEAHRLLESSAVVGKIVLTA
jgi:NADPH:quinone reductase-like Zn-dependent oxidoreductase